MKILSSNESIKFVHDCKLTMHVRALPLAEAAKRTARTLTAVYSQRSQMGIAC